MAVLIITDNPDLLVCSYIANRTGYYFAGESCFAPTDGLFDKLEYWG